MTFFSIFVQSETTRSINSLNFALSSSKVPVFERHSAPESASLVSWGHATQCVDWDQPN